MALTPFDVSITYASEALTSLKTILQKGEASPSASQLIQSRLYQDMHPLSFQVHMVTDLAQKLAARLTGAEPRSFENNLASFADCYSRIDEAQTLLTKVDKQTVDGRVGEIVPLGLGPGKNAQVSGAVYIIGYALPNLFFHLTTAYNILRKEGVPLGKMDFITPFAKDIFPKA